MSGDRKAFPVLQADYAESSPQLSPDDHWFAYQSDESGRAEVYVQHFPVSGGKWQISVNGGLHPRWRHDGKELFYLAPDGKMMAVDISVTGTNLMVATPRVLFDAHPNMRSEFAVSANGQRFLVATTPGSPEATGQRSSMTVVVNWTAVLKR